jgi:hypothetical protein
MRFAKPFRNKAVETVETLPQRLLGRTAEHLLGRRVEEHDALALINGHDRVHRGIQNAGEPGLAQPQRSCDP